MHNEYALCYNINMRTITSILIVAVCGVFTLQCNAAEGFFRLENRGGDRWELVGPDGNDTFLRGIDHVVYHGHWCDKLKGFPHLEVMKRKFPVFEDWCTNTMSRLSDWGFNALGAGSMPELRHRGFVHTEFLSMGDEWASQADENLWICPNEHRPCSAFPNVFHPEWKKHCEEVAARKCAPQKDDPQLLGYFIDNELAWWGRSPQWGVSATGLFDEAMKRPEGHAARNAAIELLKEHGLAANDKIPDEVKCEFLHRAAERYFAVTTAAIRQADPNHLVLGARFAGTGGANVEVWKIAGRYCDLVTFNCYPWADIERNIVFNDVWNPEETVWEVFKRYYDLTKKPFIITEWSFPAFDSGLPCLHGAGQRFQTQTQRTQATRLFAQSMLAMPFVIGYDYFMWVDEPALGITPAFPEDSNYGLINNEGDAYPEITGMFRDLHANLGIWRKGAVTVNGKEYAISDGHLALAGKIGNGPLFSSVTLDGRKYGTFNIMLETKEDDNHSDWPSVYEITSAVRNGNDLELTGIGGRQEKRFELTVRISSPDANGSVVAEVSSIRNLGTEKISVERMLLGAYADFAREATVESQSVHVWKSPRRGCWRTKDGRVYGVESASPACGPIFYYCSEHNIHPDAFFKSWYNRLEIAPGEKVRLHDIWASLIVQ